MLRASFAHRFGELVLYGLNPGVALITAPIMARALGPPGRGVVGVCVAVFTIAVACGNLGQGEVVLADYRQGASGDDVHQRARVARSGGIVTALISLAALLLLGVPWPAAIATAVFVPFVSQSGLWRGLTVAMGDLKAPAIAQAIGAALRLLAMIGAASLSVLNVNTTLVILNGSAALGAGIALWRKLFRSIAASRLTATIQSPWALAKRGLPVLYADILTAVAMRSDVVALQLLATESQVGLYASVLAFSQTGLVASAAFKSRVQAACFSPHARRAVARELTIVAVLVIPICCGVAAAAKPLVTALLGNAFSGAAGLLSILAIGAIALVYLDLVGGLLIVLGERRRYAMLAATNAATTVAAVVPLTYLYASTGTAIGVVSSYFATVIFAFVLLGRSRMREDPASDENQQEQS